MRLHHVTRDPGQSTGLRVPRQPSDAAVPSRAPADARRAVRRVVLIDDHRTFVDLLRFALATSSTLSCVGTAHSPEQGVAVVAAEQPDLVVMDYTFPRCPQDGVEATATITARFPQVHVVLLTGHEDDDLARRAAGAGARALLPKDGSLPDLIHVLETVGPGPLLVHPSLLRTPPADPRVSLSRREHDVLTMLAMGLGAQEISDQLGITKNTCRGYIKSLMHKLDAHTQLQAVAHARRLGLLSGTG
jgi:two-component system, NarL family, nitrate/nitrite response regulator NarL